MLSAAGRDGEDENRGGGPKSSSETGTQAEASSPDRHSARPLIRRIVEAAGPECDSRRFLEVVLTELREWTGLEAAAVRLEEAGDYPYAAAQGFPPEFISRDSHLTGYGADGRPLLDENGDALLECACGRIIRGLPHPALPEDATCFWTGSIGELSESLPPGRDTVHMRGFCKAWGYETAVASPCGPPGRPRDWCCWPASASTP